MICEVSGMTIKNEDHFQNLLHKTHMNKVLRSKKPDTTQMLQTIVLAFIAAQSEDKRINISLLHALISLKIIL